jgi:hypothetical protein
MSYRCNVVAGMTTPLQLRRWLPVYGSLMGKSTSGPFLLPGTPWPPADEADPDADPLAVDNLP